MMSSSYNDINIAFVQDLMNLGRFVGNADKGMESFNKLHTIQFLN